MWFNKLAHIILINCCRRKKSLELNDRWGCTLHAILLVLIRRIGCALSLNECVRNFHRISMPYKTLKRLHRSMRTSSRVHVDETASACLCVKHCKNHTVHDTAESAKQRLQLILLHVQWEIQHV